MKNIEIIILAAGKGTRLNEGSASPIPKVLYKIGNKPMIFYLLETLKKINIKKPTLVVGYKADSVKKEFGDSANYVLQKEQLGTGHAVNAARNELIGKSENIMVLYGDMPLVGAETLKNLIDYHQEKKPVISMLTVELDNPNYYAFGRIVRDKNGNIKKSVEQKDATEEEKKIKECNTCVYIFDAKWLWENIIKIKKSPVGEYYLTDLVGMAIEQGKKVIGIKAKNPKEFLGINTLEQLEETKELINQ